jgi:CheY-like chemotaxis protein
MMSLVVAPDDVPSTASQRSPRRAPRAASTLWAINVLVIEDDEADASLVMNVLRRHPGVGTAIAINAPDKALWHLGAGNFRPDLILLDIQMPKMNGFEFLDALDAMPGARTTPVVMITTSRFAHDVERARDSSACAYIVKPETYEEWKRRVDGVVSQTITGRWSS